MTEFRILKAEREAAWRRWQRLKESFPCNRARVQETFDALLAADAAYQEAVRLGSIEGARTEVEPVGIEERSEGEVKP
jgi:hypothetical protein